MMSYLWHGGWSRSGCRGKSWSRRRDRSRSRDWGRGEGVLRKHTCRCCGRYRRWDRVRWRDRLWLRWWYRHGVAWLVSSRGVVRRLRGHPIHHWRLCKAWRRKGRETDQVRLNDFCNHIQYV